MMLWTTTANDRKVLERLEKGLLAPKNGDLSLEEAPWAVLRLVGVPNPLALPQASEAGNLSSNNARWRLSSVLLVNKLDNDKIRYIKTPVIFLLTSLIAPPQKDHI